MQPTVSVVIKPRLYGPVVTSVPRASGRGYMTTDDVTTLPLCTCHCINESSVSEENNHHAEHIVTDHISCRGRVIGLG